MVGAISANSFQLLGQSLCFFGQCRESGEVAHGDALLRGRHRYFAGFIENGKFHVDFAVVIDGLEHVFV